MATVYLGLGTNLGSKQANLQFALDHIYGSVGRITSISPVYQSEAWGYTSANSFLNMALCVETNLGPEALLSACKAIEHDAGRKSNKGEGYADRVLDIDILYYDTLVFRSKNLSIPHPLLPERKFVLQPMFDIAPNWIDPARGKKIHEMLAACNDTSTIQEAKINIKLNNQ